MALKVYDYKTCDTLAVIGESVAECYFNKFSNIVEVQNVRNDKSYQEKDIDLICKTDKDNEFTVEVKTDSYTSGNMFYEIVSNDVTNEKGCLEKTEASILFYYFIHPEYRSAYIFDVEELREWVHLHWTDYKQKRVYNKGYCSLGFAIPLSRLVADLSKLQVVKLDCLPEIELFEEQAKSYWNKER